MELSLLNLFLVLLAAWLGGQVATRLGYPSVLGEILAGILLGPPLLGLLYGGEALSVLAEVGILLMMLYIGMEIDPRELGKASKGGVLAALGGFIVPFILGYWVVTAFGGSAVAGVFVGMAMGVTSLATKSRILVDLKILDTRISHVMMAGALITDTLSLLIFAGILSFATMGSLDLAGIGLIGIKVSLFFALSWFLGLKVFPVFYRWLNQRGFTGRTFNATLILLIAIGFAELAHLAGLHGILGAFIAGLCLREAISEKKLSHDLTGLVKDVSLGFLAPIFFVTAGFEVSFRVFQTDLALLLSAIVLATVGKILGTALFYLPSGYGWREGLTIGAGMNGRGAVEIVIAGIGLQAGIISQEIFSILVFMAISTTASVPIFLKWGVNWLEKRGELVRSSTGKDAIIIAGAGPVAQFLAKELASVKPVILIDRNEMNVTKARDVGLNAIQGDALDNDVLLSANIDKTHTLIALTPNAEVNVLIARRAHDEHFVPQIHALLSKDNDRSLLKLLEQINAQPLFLNPAELLHWDEKLNQRQAQALLKELDPKEALHEQLQEKTYLPLLVQRGSEKRIFVSLAELEPGDRVLALSV